MVPALAVGQSHALGPGLSQSSRQTFVGPLLSSQSSKWNEQPLCPHVLLE
jgi:hypothetical protein